MNRAVLEAVAELSVREDWSDAARRAALEARRSKAHGILKRAGSVAPRGPVLDVTEFGKDSFGRDKDPWTLAERPDGSVRVQTPEGDEHSVHPSWEKAAEAVVSHVRHHAHLTSLRSTTARSRAAGEHNRRLHRGGY